MQSVGRDVTERVAAEARFLAAAETLPDGLAIFDAEDRLVYHNSRHPEHQNLRATLALGKCFEDWLRDGITLGPIHHPDMGEAFLERRLEMRLQNHADHEQHLADGRWVRVREARMPDGGRVHLTSDITQQRSLEAELRQAEKLRAVGTLASGIAHEFNNILGVMLGYGEMAIRVLRRNALARGHVEQIMTAGGRAQGIIDQILAFSRHSVHKRQSLRAQTVIVEAIEFIRACLPATVAFETHLEAEGATILSSPTELQQVVMNLCTNAAQAMDGRGSLAIGLTSVDIAGERALSHGSLPAGRYVRLSVSDTGPGVEPAIMDRLFEPFFTTKAVGEGTGLGLATVHGIVTEHGGAVSVGTRLGAGTTFEAYFPQTSGETVAEAPRSEKSGPRGDGETILFVDDERSLVLLGEEMLAAIGYKAVGFNKSSAALAAFRASPDRFDLVLTDEIMPEMTGTALAIALHEIRPEIPIILMTGYAGELRADRQQAAGIGGVLRKPILSKALSLCLAQHLPGP